MQHLMVLLKDSSRSTQFEAFHVFKVDGALHVHVHVHAVHLCGTS